MNVTKITKFVQRRGALALVGGMVLLSGCGPKTSSHIPLSGPYLEHITGKSFALVFDSTSVSAWENYGESGPGAKNTGPLTCLSKGSTYTVTGQTVQIQGGTQTSTTGPAAPFTLTGAQTTLQMGGGGFALVLPLASGGKLTFMKL